MKSNFWRKLTVQEKAWVDYSCSGENYKYVIIERTIIHSDIYNKDVILEVGDLSDGATCAIDICPPAFFGHDDLCVKGHWADGTPCTNRQASTFHSEILSRESKRYWKKSGWKNKRRSVRLKGRSIWRWLPTFIFGGGKCRDKMW